MIWIMPKLVDGDWLYNQEEKNSSQKNEWPKVFQG